MKKVILFLVACLLLFSCKNFAEKYNLPPDPAKNLTVEMLDDSTFINGGATLYTSFTLSHSDWAEYLFASATLICPPNSSSEARTMDVVKNSDGEFIITHKKESNLIWQGNYSLELSAGVDQIETTYTENYNINVDGVGTKPLSARVDQYNIPQEPYICSGIALYKLAVSNDSDMIYIYPNDAYSASQDIIVYIINSNKLEYVALLPAGQMEETKWTAFTLSDLIYNQNTATALNATAMRIVNSNWSFQSYASNSTSTNWGILYRSELRDGVFETTVPAEENIISLNRGSARNIDSSFIISPLAQIKWNSFK